MSIKKNLFFKIKIGYQNMKNLRDAISGIGTGVFAIVLIFLIVALLIGAIAFPVAGLLWFLLALLFPATAISFWVLYLIVCILIILKEII